MKRICLFCFRTLYSQSASSLTVEKISSELAEKGFDVTVNLLRKEDHYSNYKAFKNALSGEIIIYKTNYQDFEYGIRFFSNLRKHNKKADIILIGPFSCLNKKSILTKYPFVTAIYNQNELDSYLTKKLGVEITTVFRDAKNRQIEANEKGKYANIERSIGCIHNCNFCHIPLTNKKVIEKTAKDVVDEIEYLVKVYGKRYFIFNDSIFWKGKKDTKFIKEFNFLIKKRKLNIFFMIYLALGNMIPDEELLLLKEAGLVRFFFGIESITDDFQINNPKNISAQLADNFIGRLQRQKISYHVGFILFYPESTVNNILLNIDYLYSLGGLFRLGIIREKMRILPSSPNSDILYYNGIKIDQAYNYSFTCKEVSEAYYRVCSLISLIDYRSFESFFTVLDLIIAMVARDGKGEKIENIKRIFLEEKEYANNRLLKLLKDTIINDVSSRKESELLDLYSRAENMFLFNLSQLEEKGMESYIQFVPHGKEELNVEYFYD